MLTLCIQSGGQSSRMGHDKAILPFLGEALIQRVKKRLAHLADEVLVTANDPNKYSFLEVRVVPDVIPDMGALGGLYTALKLASHPLVAVIACDLPFANPELLAFCRDILLNTDADAAVPGSGKGLEPLHAVYRRKTCLPLVEAALEANKRRMISWHADAKIRVLSPGEVAQYDPDGVTFWNVNTPEEFRRAETRARALEQNQTS